MANHTTTFLTALVGSVLAIAPMHAQRVNFAKYQPAFASSTNTSYAPTFATDGLASNFHTFRTTNTNGPHWLEVRFPKSLTIGSAHLYLGINNNPGNAFSQFKIQYRTTHGSWLDVPGTEVFGNTFTEIVVPFPDPVSADRFRILSNDNGARHVRQFALFPPNPVAGLDQGYPIGTDVRLSLAHQRPATASSINDGNHAKNAVDGYVNNSARWLANGGSANQSIEIDLLVAHAIGSAHIYSGWDGNNAISDFVLEYHDGSNWQLVPGTTVTGNNSTARNVIFSSNVTTSRVRLRTTTASTARIKEFLVFPPKSGGYPLGQDVEFRDPPSAKWHDYSDDFLRLKNSGPDLRLALVDGVIRFIPASRPVDQQEWQLLLNYRDGSYRVRHVATGLCLSQPGPSSVAGDSPIVESYSALPWQDWILDQKVEGDFHLLNAWSGLSLRSRNGLWEADNPLDLANPESGALQRWTAVQLRHHPKKGLAGWEGSFNQFNAFWSYNWSLKNPTWHPFWHSFNPMQWGDSLFQHSNHSQGVLDDEYVPYQRSSKPAHLLGFNEPDQSGQANMSVAAAIERWPRLEAMNAPLIAPVTASTFGGWLSSFVSQANASGYRRDYTAVHWYAGPDANALIQHLADARDAFGRPVWLTEFSNVRWSGSATWTHQENWNFLAEFMWRAESLPWLKRYSLFQFTQGSGSEPDPSAAPRSNTRASNGSLTPYGELYAGWDGDDQLRPYKAYHIQNRGAYQRMRNAGAASPDFVAPESSGSWTQWMLVSSQTPDRWRIVSLRDGRPLEVVANQVVLGATGQSGPSVEWQLNEHEFGWFFMDHPQTNRRLRNLSGDYQMVSPPADYIGELVQWRLAVPASPEDASQPLPPPALSATAGTHSIALNWTASPSAGPITYNVHRRATSNCPCSLVATGINTLTWVDAGLPAETTFHYVVTATNSFALGSEPSAEASATTLHPHATYATWATVELPPQPGRDTTPLGNPDGDGLANLLEYGFLTNPLAPDVGIPEISRSVGGAIRLSFPWNWRATDYRWQLRHGQDLSAIRSWPVIDPGPVDKTRVHDVDRIIVSPLALAPQYGFFVLEMIPDDP